MKRGLFFAIATMLFASVANATIKGTPYLPEVDRRFDSAERQLGTLITDSAEGLRARRYAHVIYDIASEGGSVANHSLGVVIPNKAVLMKGLLYFKTAFTYGGGTAPTIALTCKSAGDVLVATNLLGHAAGSMLTLTTSGGIAPASAFGSQIMGPVGPINGACELVATVANTALTAGKMDIMIDYYVAE
jgi:hypothetical protein